MRYLKWSAPVRNASVQVVAVAAVLTFSASGTPSPTVPHVEAASASATEIADGMAIHANRVIARVTPEVSYDAVSVEVQPSGTPGEYYTGGLPASVTSNKVLAYGATFVGTPYRWGGRGPHSFDCSGFVAYVYGHFGVDMPASTAGYWNFGERVSAEDARPGDIVLTPGHVGIYAGGNLVLEAPNASGHVTFRIMWQRDPIFVRVVGDDFWDEPRG